MSITPFGPQDAVSLFLTLLGFHWVVFWFAFTRRLFTAASKRSTRPTLHWLVWSSIGAGFVAVYVALVMAVRSGAIDRFWLGDVALGLFLITCGDLAILAVRERRSRESNGEG